MIGVNFIECKKSWNEKMIGNLSLKKATSLQTCKDVAPIFSKSD